MGRLLICPFCRADFSFAEWSKTACCPHCGARVDFTAASDLAAAAVGSGTGIAAAVGPSDAAGAVVGGSSAAAVGASRAAAAVVRSQDVSEVVSRPVVPASSSAPASSGERLHVFGKPLAFTRAWLVVFAVWAVAGGLLAAARIEMGHLPLLSARERAAIAAVEKARMADGTTFAQALRLTREASDPLHGLSGQVPLGDLALKQSAPRWYVIDRPWEHTVYVAWELDDQLSGQVMRLVWTVKGATVKADPASYALLQRVVKSAARNPGIDTSPAVLPDPDVLATTEPSPAVP